MILVGRGAGALLKSAGLSSYSELDWDDSVTVKDARVHFLEAIHTSRRESGTRTKRCGARA
jgi:L-ascorbate metabolism protein UlaG (beta-lactamase superfamily)